MGCPPPSNCIVTDTASRAPFGQNALDLPALAAAGAEPGWRGLWARTAGADAAVSARVDARTKSLLFMPCTFLVAVGGRPPGGIGEPERPAPGFQAVNLRRMTAHD